MSDYPEFEKWYDTIDHCDARKLLTEAYKKMPKSKNKELAQEHLKQREFCHTLKRATFYCVQKYLYA